MKQAGLQEDLSWVSQGSFRGILPTDSTRLRLIRVELDAVVSSHPLLQGGKSDSCCVSRIPYSSVLALGRKGAYLEIDVNWGNGDFGSSEKLGYCWRSGEESWGLGQYEAVAGRLACDLRRCGNGSVKGCMNAVCDFDYGGR